MTTARPAADGTFTISGIVPNQDYRVFVNPILLPLGNQPAPTPPALQNAFVKSVTLGGMQADLLNTGFRMTTQAGQQLVITLGNNAGTLEGRVMNGREPVLGATVVLIPDSAQRFHINHKVANTDQAGHFKIFSVPPGDYKLFAWEDIEPFAYTDPDFLRKYENLGVSIKVSESQNMMVEARLIPAGQ